MKLLFLFPTINEMSSISKQHQSYMEYQEKNFSYMTCGIGYKATSIFRHLSPDILPVIIGYGGALSPELNTGDVVISTTFLATNQEIITSENIGKSFYDILIEKQIPVYLKPCFTSNYVISTCYQKKELYNQGAWVVDMESFHLAQKLSDTKTPFVSIRVILDTYNIKLPDLTNTLQSNGQISPRKTILHILRNPHHIYHFIKILFLTKKAKPIIKKCCYSISESYNNI